MKKYQNVLSIEILENEITKNLNLVLIRNI
jgi:hypothetical protein